MKIISKYKDFYDYSWIDNDPDLVYVRKEKVCFSMPHIETPSDKSIGDGIRTYWANKGGFVDIIGYTFGIYPFVYVVPAIHVILDSCGTHWTRIFTRDEIELLSSLKDKNDIKQFFATIYNSAFETNKPKPQMVLGYVLENRPYSNAIRYSWKKECPDIFMKIESPVFVMFNTDILGQSYKHLSDVEFKQKWISQIQLVENDKVYANVYTGKVEPKLVTNVCFNKLAIPLHKYWIEDLNNTYSNIENFLMTSKLDPEPIISNNGKIIAHGFDLKTSFRNM